VSRVALAALAAACLTCTAVRGAAQAAPPSAPSDSSAQEAPAPPAGVDAQQAEAKAAESQEASKADEAAEQESKLAPPAALLTAREVQDRLAALAAAHADLARVETYGTSFGGLPLQALVVAAPGRPLAEAQGLLFVAGLDGRRAADAGVLLAVAETLLADAGGDLRARLGDAALVFIPRANPDGAEALSGARGPRREQAGNGRPDDADRDGRTDEDGPADLDGDGAIAWLAVPDGEGTWVFDEHDPRALRKARTERGEAGTHRLLLEGRDADGDGAENEDGTDGAQPDGNFPHGWREYQAASGAFPLSEPEARALADFVLAHPRLGGVFVVGGQDTLVGLPKAATNAPGGRGFDAPLDGVHADDVASLKELQRRLLALGKAQDHEPETKGDGLTGGSFLAWAYHQAGRWPLALCVWAPPTELPKPGKSKEGAKPGDAEKSEGAAKPDGEPKAEDGAQDEAAAKPDDAAKPEEAAQADDDAPPEGGKRGKGGKGGKAKDDEESDDDKPRSDADSPAPAAVLAWLDTAREGAGFVPWHAFTHDQLGEVQLGGLLPGVAFTPPQKDADATAALLAPFALTLLDCLPRVTLEDLKVTGSDGVGAIEVAVVNRGVLPTLPQLAASARLSRPLHVELVLPEGAARLSGDAQQFIDRLAGGGGRQTLRWVIAGSSGQKVTLRVESPSVPAVTLEIPLP